MKLPRRKSLHLAAGVPAPVGRRYHSRRCRGYTLTSRRLHALRPLDFARDHPELVRQATVAPRGLLLGQCGSRWRRMDSS
jgi:hypothetical protein